MSATLSKYKLVITADDGYCFPTIESDTPFLGFSIGELINAQNLPTHPTILCDYYKIIEVTHHIVEKDRVLFSHMVEVRVEAAETEREGDSGDTLDTK